MHLLSLFLLYLNVSTQAVVHYPSLPSNIIPSTEHWAGLSTNYNLDGLLLSDYFIDIIEEMSRMSNNSTIFPV